MRTITVLILSASALLAQTSNPSPEQARQAQNQAGLEARLKELENQADQAQQQMRLRNVQEEEAGLEKKLAELAVTYSETHPQVRVVKAQLERLRATEQELKAQSAAGTAARAATLAYTEASLVKTKAREAEIEARLSQLPKDHRDTPMLQQQLESLRAQERNLSSDLRSASPNSQALNIAPADTARVSLDRLARFSPRPLDPQDRWWRNTATAQSLGLSADQQKRMDDVLQQYRLKLVDVNGTLQKEEIALEPLVGADKLDESKVTAQIDRVAQARAELEKVNGRMLLQIRKQLTADQWRKLNK